MKDALAKIRKTNMPFIIEMDTYRYRGHSMSDPGKYRTRDEIEDVRQSRDPITRLHAALVEDYGIKDEKLKEIDKETKARVAEVAEMALNAPEPSLEELTTDVMPA